MLESVLDLSEVDQLSQARAAQSALRRLMAVAGHDLKQPVQIAAMAIARAMQDGIYPQALAGLKLALDTLGRLGYELDDLARTSQTNSAICVRREAVHIGGLAEEVVADWASYALWTGRELCVAPSSLVVQTDRVMLGTILRNFVGNGLKYSRPGGRVLIGCRRRGGEVIVEVHDNGPGIEAHRLSSIFNAFSRGEHEGSASGLGLGLHIVRQTSGMLDHAISVRSTVGRGSTFAVAVPQAQQTKFA